MQILCSGFFGTRIPLLGTSWRGVPGEKDDEGEDKVRWKRINKGIKHMMTRWLTALWGLNSTTTSGLRWWPQIFQDTGASVLHFILTPQFTVPTTPHATHQHQPPLATSNDIDAQWALLILICNDFREMAAASIVSIAHKLKIPDSSRWQIGYWQRNHKQIEISHWSTVVHCCTPSLVGQLTRSQVSKYL